MIEVSTPLESGPGFHTVRPLSGTYKPMAAGDFKDEPARMTERQASFYRNLIAVAQETQSGVLPVIFDHATMGTVFWDRGCIRIAEHAGFIRPLTNGPSGYVETLELAFKVTAK